MNSSLKLKFNQATGETELTNAEGQDLLAAFPYVTDIKIEVSSTGPTKVTITSVILNTIEFETDKAVIEQEKIMLGYIKEKEMIKPQPVNVASEIAWQKHLAGTQLKGGN